MFEKQIVIDGKGHLLGRLASVVAKELLNGQCIVVVRSEQIFVTGSRKSARRHTHRRLGPKREQKHPMREQRRRRLWSLPSPPESR